MSLANRSRATLVVLWLTKWCVYHLPYNSDLSITLKISCTYFVIHTIQGLGKTLQCITLMWTLLVSCVCYICVALLTSLLPLLLIQRQSPDGKPAIAHANALHIVLLWQKFSC